MMATVNLIEYAQASPEVRAVCHPPTLRRTWETLKSVMAPGALDALTREMVYPPTRRPRASTG